MSLLFPYWGRFLERVLPGPVRTAEKGSDDRQCDSDHEADGENCVRDESLARKPTANTLTILTHVGQQHQSRYQQPRHHDASPERRIANEFLQAEEVPWRLRRIRGMDRVGYF